MTIFLRSLLFNVGLVVWTACVGIFGLPTLLGPGRWSTGAILVWSRGVLAWAKFSVNIDVRISGLENLPDTSVILASKHQSAWETFGLIALIPNAVVIMKRTVLLIPLIGWYLLSSGHLPIDRGGNATALRKMLKLMARAKSQGRHILIFPEGTRVPVGAAPELKIGALALARQGKMPIVPVSLDTGRVWPRNSFRKYPGVISIRVHPPLAYNLDKPLLLRQLHHSINTDPASYFRKP
jgi:1-acyl-sn-glycerol-3-phosphate acyltransferase